MPKKKKHMRLPNSFGSIRHLSGNRRNCYGVYEPATEFAPDGTRKSPKAIAYVDDWYKAFYILLARKNGNLSDALIEQIKNEEISSGSSDAVVKKILAAYNGSRPDAKNSRTFAQMYHEWYDWKFSNKQAGYADSTAKVIKSAFAHCGMIADRAYSELKTADFQEVVDGCPLKRASKGMIVNLLKQVGKYALQMDYVEKDFASFVRVNCADDGRKGEPFTIEEIDRIWDASTDDKMARSILVMIYSGFRVSAYTADNFRIDGDFFVGGVKTSSGIDRRVPIHPLIKDFIADDLPLFRYSTTAFRKHYMDALVRIGITTRRTCHSTRHTFSWLLDRYGVDMLSKKLLMGHSLGSDVTSAVYGHRTDDELVTEMLKIRHW